MYWITRNWTIHFTEDVNIVYIFVTTITPIAVLYCPFHSQLIQYLSRYHHFCHSQGFLLYDQPQILNEREACLFNRAVQKVTLVYDLIDINTTLKAGYIRNNGIPYRLVLACICCTDLYFPFKEIATTWFVYWPKKISYFKAIKDGPFRVAHNVWGEVLISYPLIKELDKIKLYLLRLWLICKLCQMLS